MFMWIKFLIVLSLTLILEFILMDIFYIDWWVDSGMTIFGFIFISGAVVIPSTLSVINVISTLWSLFTKHDQVSDEYYTNSSVDILIPIYARNESDVKLLKDSLDSLIGSTSNMNYINMIYVINNNSKYPLVIPESSKISLISESTPGKWAALNKGWNECKSDLILTVDADTIIRDGSVESIVRYIEHFELDAVAGNLVPLNDKDSLITKMQVFDYILGIQNVKFSQNLYHSTLVAQGAFSIYRRSSIIDNEPFKDCIGEDIDISWNIILGSGKIGFSRTSIAYTDVPVSLKEFRVQRSRWSRGLIYGFKKYKLKCIKNPLISILTMIPYMDLVYFICWPLVLVSAFFGDFRYVGLMSLLILPFSLIHAILYWNLSKNRIRFNILNFTMFILLFQLISSYSSIYGYIEEILNRKHIWK